MSFVAGTATSSLDLLARLVTFLTTDAALAAATPAQTWTLLKDDTTVVTTGNETVRRTVYLRGPGLAGTDQIYVIISAYDAAGVGYYNWEIRGANGFSATDAIGAQPGVSPPVYVSLWNTTIGYRFAASGRRFIVSAKVGTVYASAYAGLILPYETPAQWGYPLYIGGTSGVRTKLYSDTTDTQHSGFHDPAGDVDYPGAYVRWVDATWLSIVNWRINAGYDTQRQIWPYMALGDGSQRSVSTSTREAPDGSYAITPLILHGPSPYLGCYGELDGCGYVSGFGQVAEAAITIGADTWRALPNVYRSGVGDYWALKES